MPLSTPRWAMERGEVLSRYRWLWDDLYLYVIPTPTPSSAGGSRFTRRGIRPGMGWILPDNIAAEQQATIVPCKHGIAMYGDPTGTYNRRTDFGTPLAPGPSALSSGTRLTMWAAAQLHPTQDGYTLGSRPFVVLGDNASNNDARIRSINAATDGVSYRMSWSLTAGGTTQNCHVGTRTTYTEAGKNFTFGGTLDGTAMKAYWNGVVEGTATLSGSRGTTLATKIGIGGHPGAPTSHPYDVDGGIYIGGIWLAPLSAAAMVLLAREPFAPFQRRRIFGAVVPGVNVRLLENGTERAKRRVPLSRLTDDHQRTTIDLTTAEKASISDWTALQLEVGAPSKGTLKLHRAYVQVPKAAGVDYWYLLNSTTPDGWMKLQVGGTAPATTTTGTGWDVTGVAATQYSRLEAGVIRAPGTFSGTAQPSSGPDNTLKDCWRTQNKVTVDIPAGTWTIPVPVIAYSAIWEGATARVRVRLWQSSNADGSSATELTSGAVTGTTVTALQSEASSISTATVSLGAIVFTSKYLFVQIALETV